MKTSRSSWRRFKPGKHGSKHVKVSKGSAKDFAPRAPIGTSCLLHLSWPTSVNKYWRSIPLEGRVKVLVSEDGRAYQKAVAGECLLQKATQFGAARIRYVAIACAPDNGVHDLGNLNKALEDSLTKAGVWDDDRQVDDYRYLRGPVVPGGRIDIMIEAIG